MTYTITVPDRGIEGIEVEVFNFTEPGGVALSMYNTDEVWIFHIYSSLFCSMTIFVVEISLEWLKKKDFGSTKSSQSGISL